MQAVSSTGRAKPWSHADALIGPALAHSLRMKVVAEGVETLEQLGYLRANRCDEVQGYYLCKPITADEMSRFLERDLRNFVTPTAAA